MPASTSLCCRCFPLPCSPEAIWESYEYWILNKGEGKDHRGKTEVRKVPPNYVDSEKLVECLRFIGQRMYVPTLGAIEARPALRGAQQVAYLYTCAWPAGLPEPTASPSRRRTLTSPTGACRSAQPAGSALRVPADAPGRWYSYGQNNDCSRMEMLLNWQEQLRELGLAPEDDDHAT